MQTDRQNLTDARRTQLGDFLRSRREQLRPKTQLIASGRNRRTPGLRREEVAELAGIGVDWYTRLEQGRRVTPSRTTVDALADALRLNKAEHAHLRALAQTADGPVFEREVVTPTLARMLDGLASPAYIAGRRWDVVAWNAAADQIFAFGRLSEGDRNILVCMLTKPQTRRLFGTSWLTEAQRMVAQFRVTHDLWAGDPAFAALLDRLRRESSEFAAWWDGHDVRDIAGGLKTLVHPKRGVMRFEHASFQANDDPNLKLVICTPVGTSPRRLVIGSGSRD